MYHRIATERVDPWRLCVSPSAFEEQIAVIARARAAVDLAAVARGQCYTAGGRHVAVTFDDGYLDNVTAALPVLERHDVPMTLFTVATAPGRTREFWWDALMRAVLEAATLPARLTLEAGAQTRDFTVADTPADADAAPTWIADLNDPRTPRERLYLQLWDAIAVLPPEEQDRAVDAVLAWAGQPLAPPADRLPMSVEQFASVAAHPLITVGSHTAHHPSLPDLDDESQAAEIAGGHRRLEEMAGARIDRFSYPFGRHDARARAVVRSLNVAAACTSQPAAATTASDPLQLPRLQATEMDGEAFARWLRDGHGLLAGAAA